MNTPPVRPQGVVVHIGHVPHPADLTYAGVRADGLHVWYSDIPISPGADVKITVDVLPPKTLVMLPLRGDS